MLVHFTFIERT